MLRYKHLTGGGANIPLYEPLFTFSNELARDIKILRMSLNLIGELKEGVAGFEHAWGHVEVGYHPKLYFPTTAVDDEPQKVEDNDYILMCGDALVTKNITAAAGSAYDSVPYREVFAPPGGLPLRDNDDLYLNFRSYISVDQDECFWRMAWGIIYK